MSFTKKRPTLLRLFMTLLLGVLASAGILMVVQRFYQEFLEKSALREPFFILAGISAVVIALLLVFPANRPAWLIKWFWRLVVLAVALALIWGIGVYYIAQNDMLYMPGRREAAAEDALLQLPAVEEIRLTSQDGQVSHGYFWKTMPEKSGLVLYLGGNGELAAGRLYGLVRENAASLLAGYHFMMVDYPGYGQSTGEPTEDSITAMAGAALDYALARPDVDLQRLVIAGWSLGTGPATRLAAARQPAGLILMAPFYNGTEMVTNYLRTHMTAPPLISRLAAMLVRNKYTSDLHAKQITAPVLILAGKADTVIPFEQAERLAAQFPAAQLVALEGGHLAPWTDQTSLQAIAAFLTRIALPAVPANP